MTIGLFDPSVEADNFGDDLAWQYVGFENGVYVLYPGVSDEYSGSTCGSYDLRGRPWYKMGYKSGSNVVLLVDSSEDTVICVLFPDQKRIILNFFMN